MPVVMMRPRCCAGNRSATSAAPVGCSSLRIASRNVGLIYSSQLRAHLRDFRQSAAGRELPCSVCTAFHVHKHLIARAIQVSGQSSTALAPDMTKTKVLFVCLGNICRSPTAEAVLKKVVDRAGVADEFVIDSCGTGGGNEDWYKLDTKDAWAYHEGHPADERMTAAAKKRDIHLTSRSRPLKPDDFTNFDYIIGMDFENSKAIKQAAAHWQDDLNRSLPDNWQDKIKLMCTYLTKDEYKELQEVPDPYFGGAEGFEKVLDLLEDACEGLVSHIESSKFATES